MTRAFRPWPFLLLPLLLPFSPGRASPPTPTLKVLTLNVFAGTREMDFERLARQLRMVQELGADVICLQEIYDHRVKAAYERAFPDFDFVHAKEDSDPSALRDLAQQFAKTEGEKAILFGFKLDTAILLNRARGSSSRFSTSVLPFAAPEIVPPRLTRGGYVAGTPAEEAKLIPLIRALEKVKPKGYVATRYLVDGVDIVVANMRLSNGVHNPARMRQIREVARDLFETDDFSRPRNSYPTLLCGDTNADGAEPEMEWLRTQTPFRDSYLDAHPDLTRAPHGGMTWDARDNELTFGRLVEPSQRVDYVYYAPGAYHAFELVGSRIVLDERPLVSDHYGVLTELRLVPAGPSSPRSR